MQYVNLDSQILNSAIFALVYGASGTGKTHLMGTLGELGRTLIIDIDQGIKTLVSAKDLKGTNNLTVVSFDSFKDLNTVAQLVEQNDPIAWSKALKTEVIQPFDWVVWDTWSELQWAMMEERRSSNKDMKGDGLNFRANIQIQDWGALTDLNKLAIHNLRNCNVNQVFTMQEKLDKDEKSGQIYGGPAIHGKMVQEMPTYFDVVVHTYCDLAGNFCATTKAKGKWPAKTRLGAGTDYKNPKAKDLFAR